MKRIIVASLLFITVQQLSLAQTVAAKKIPSVPKKALTVRDLNALETEKIKALISNSTSKSDTAVRKDTLQIKKSATVISKEIKRDSVKTVIKLPQRTDTITVNKKPAFDSVVRKVQPINILEEKPAEVLENKTVPKVPDVKSDSMPKVVYTKSERLADSIKNAHKYWLDSTLAALPKTKPVVIFPDDEIEIFITGGGLYTGVNPTVYNRLTIYNSGLVHKETKTKLQGEKVEDKKISKDVLRKLAQYIIDQGFFDFNYLYDCDSKDKDCNTRLKMSPEPSPLSVVVTVGARRKKIYVALYAPHMESNWVNYPASLEKIVNAIYDVANK